MNTTASRTEKEGRAVETFEVWRNTGEGRIVIRRMNELGGYRHESVRGGGEVHLSEQERRYNQSQSTAEQDPFTNSMLIRVDEAADAADTSKPNEMPSLDRLSIERIDSLLDVHWKTMEKAIGEMASAVALRRILSRAEETGASAKRIDRIKERLVELSPDGPLPRKATRKVSVDSDIKEPQAADIYNMGPEAKSVSV